MNPNETRVNKNPDRVIVRHFVLFYKVFKEGNDTPVETDWGKKMDEHVQYYKRADFGSLDRLIDLYWEQQN